MINTKIGEIGIQNTICVPVRNCLSLTKQFMETAQAQDIPTQVLVLDDASRDGTYEYLQSSGISVYTIKNPAGVSFAWNKLLWLAFDTWNLDHALVCNNDILLRPDTYRLLLQDGGDFVTASSVEGNPDGDWRTPTKLDTARHPGPNFSCFLIRKKVWDTVGPFDEIMKIYASDCDYHLRLHNYGIEAYAINLPFYHVGSGTIKQSSPEESARIQRQADLDRQAFQWKWGFACGSPEYAAEFK